MTPQEHAVVWRKATEMFSRGLLNQDHAGWAICNAMDKIAIAYEEAAKEQEGRD